MNWLRKLMYGRYGVDQLSFCILIFALLLDIIGVFAHFQIFKILGLILLLICYLRTFSKNTYKRINENNKFLTIYNPIKNKINLFIYHTKDKKTHKYLKCPNCKQKLRVPRNVGKLTVTCPKCKTEFKKKA